MRNNITNWSLVISVIIGILIVIIINKGAPVTRPVTPAPWKVISNSIIGVSLTYPPAYIPSINTTSGSKELSFSETNKSYTAGIAPVFTLSRESLGSGQLLREWIHSFGVSDSNITEVLIGSRTYLKWFESGGEGDASAISYSTIAPNNDVVTITAYSSSLATSSDFRKILASLKITRP